MSESPGSSATSWQVTRHGGPPSRACSLPTPGRTAARCRERIQVPRALSRNLGDKSAALGWGWGQEWSGSQGARIEGCTAENQLTCPAPPLPSLTANLLHGQGAQAVARDSEGKLRPHIPSVSPRHWPALSSQSGRAPLPTRGGRRPSRGAGSHLARPQQVVPGPLLCFLGRSMERPVVGGWCPCPSLQLSYTAALCHTLHARGPSTCRVLLTLGPAWVGGCRSSATLARILT